MIFRSLSWYFDLRKETEISVKTNFRSFVLILPFNMLLLVLLFTNIIIWIIWNAYNLYEWTYECTWFSCSGHNSLHGLLRMLFIDTLFHAGFDNYKIVICDHVCVPQFWCMCCTWANTKNIYQASYILPSNFSNIFS